MSYLGLAGLGAGVHGPSIVGLVDGVACWSQTLQGHGPWREGLRSIAGAFGATAVTLTKVGRDDSGRSKSISIDLVGARQCNPIDKSYCDYIIGSYLPQAKIGSVWYATMALDLNAPALVDLNKRRRVAETAIIVLGHDTKWVYLIELHFEFRLSSGPAGLLTSLCDTLCKAWQRRAPGLFSEALLEHQPVQMNGALAKCLLADDNPAKLSRAEFRLALLLSKGLSRDALLEELSISISTLRTHIRQICAKTDCPNMNALQYRLMMTHRPDLAAQQVNKLTLKSA